MHIAYLHSHISGFFSSRWREQETPAESDAGMKRDLSACGGAFLSYFSFERS